MNSKYKYLFGPVPSRRLGRSLGIDVTPQRACSFDCVYCQCGPTTSRTTAREEFVPFAAVCAELEQWLAEDGEADAITFAGSGEPTLYSHLGEMIAFIKNRTTLPIIVLSNGTLLNRPMVRDNLLRADVVKITLSAWNEESFRAIHRPSPQLSFDSLLEGAVAFRKQYGGELWLEVFVVDGLNSAPEQIQMIAEMARRIRPDRIHLNTAVRPPAASDVQPTDKQMLEQYCDLFVPKAEVIASFSPPASARRDLNTDALVELIRRHPATAAQLAAISGTTEQKIRAALAPLIEAALLDTEERGGETWYK